MECVMGRNTATTVTDNGKKNPANAPREHEASAAHAQSPAT